MADGYLLACKCGRSHVIRVQQAGEAILCECGGQLDIPTLREIRVLPTATASDKQPRPRRPANWTLTRGILFAVGTALALIALASFAWYAWQLSRLDTDRPSLTDLTYRRDVMDLTPSEAWDAWTEIFRGRQLGGRIIPEHVEHQALARRYSMLAGITGGFAALGIMMAAGAIFIDRRT